MGTTSTLAEPTGLSSRVVGTCMIAAPVALLVGELLHPAAQHDAAAQLQVLGHNPARQYAAHLIFIVALILVVPTLLGLANLLGARRAAWGQVGLGLGIARTVAAFAGAELVTWQVGKAAEHALAFAVGLGSVGLGSVGLGSVGLGSVGLGPR